MQYGSELLANEIVVSSEISSYEVTTLDLESIDTYGIFNLTRTGLLINANGDVDELAEFYANKYSQPEYRFESVEVLLDELTDQEKIEKLNEALQNITELTIRALKWSIASIRAVFLRQLS